MTQVKSYKAKKPFKLDCGHLVKAGDSFAVIKVFTCEADAKRVGLQKVETAPSQK